MCERERRGFGGVRTGSASDRFQQVDSRERDIGRASTPRGRECRQDIVVVLFT